MLNYFELMNLPQTFDIDIDKLQQHLRLLQARFHPDSNPQDKNLASNLEATYAQSTSEQPLQDAAEVSEAAAKLASVKPEQASAIINEAYNTLKNPDSRAVHLLALKGVVQSINQPIRDLDFLDAAMSFRIELEDANRQSIEPLNQKLTNWLSSYEYAFNDVYQDLAIKQFNTNEHQALITKATDMIQKLQFLVKLKADVAKTTDELAKQSFNHDDDLYV